MTEKSKILIVDDMEENLFVMKQILKEVGQDGLPIETFTAISGNEALRIALHHDFALIILDVKMPEMDGYELAQMFRSKRETQKIPIIFMSATFTTEYSVFKGYETGAVDFLAKPVDPKIIMTKVKTFVELDQQKKELEEANIKLRELDRMKNMFVASMSHELRTPLNSIIGFTGIILMGLSGELTDEQKKQLTMVKSSANHLLSLINDIIDVSKIEAGKVDLSIEEFDLPALLREVKDSFIVAINEKGLDISLKVPEGLMITSDERRVKQTIVNLVGNAVKFTEEGEIAIRSARKDKIIEVIVRDTGPGIRKDDLDMLFKAFSRVSVEGTIKEGTGLGLYLSKKIANLLGGEISAESEFGRGTEFTLTMPVKYEEVEGR